MLFKKKSKNNKKEFNEILQELKSDQYLLSLTSDKWKNFFPDVQITKSKKYYDSPLISIIISNFGNAEYLPRLFQSIVKQTIGLKNIEVIFVDDASSDDSVKIANSFLKKYPNFTIATFQENTGMAAIPRNFGLTIAKGEYIQVMDSDDWYQKDGLNKMYQVAKETKTGVVSGGIYRVINNKVSIDSPSYNHTDGKIIPINNISKYFYGWLGPQSLLIKKNIIDQNNLHFPLQKTADDVKFFFECVIHSGAISQTKEMVTYLNRDPNENRITEVSRKSYDYSQNYSRVINYFVNNYGPSIYLNKFLARRFDWLTREFFGVKRNITNKNNKNDYLYVLSLFIDVIKNENLNFIDLMSTDYRRKVIILLKEDKIDSLNDFVKWDSKPERNRIVKRNGSGIYYEPEDNKLPIVYKNIETRLLEINSSAEQDEIIFSAVTWDNRSVDGIRLAHRRQDKIDNNFELVAKNIGNNIFRFTLEKGKIEKMVKGKYKIELRYDGFLFTPIFFGDVDPNIKSNFFYKTNKNNIGAIFK